MGTTTVGSLKFGDVFVTDEGVEVKVVRMERVLRSPIVTLVVVAIADTAKTRFLVKKSVNSMVQVP